MRWFVLFLTESDRVPATIMKVNVNMNKTYREVVARMANPTEKLSHKQTVTRLYKQSLKTLDSWVVDRRIWNEEATKIREEFNQNMALDQHSG